MVKHFNGLLQPERGVVRVGGIDTKNLSTAKLARTVGYVFQYPDSQIFARTLFEEVSFGPRNLGFSEKQIERAVSSSFKIVDLKKSYRLSPMSLSTGEKERLAIADVLAIKPKVLILDEPTTGQDYLTCQKVMKIARDYADMKNVVIFISHDIDLVAEWSDRVIVMSEGRIICNNKPEEIFSDFELLEKIELSPPQVSKLAKSLNFEKIPITVNEMVNTILRGVNIENSKVY